MERRLVLSIAILALINIFDSVANSVVGPSLIFYVTEMGGSKEQYGLIMSISFLIGMVMMPVYGGWVDSNGSAYQAPYAACFTFGIVGSAVYFLAAVCPRGTVGVAMILAGRLITGMGTAGRTLAYSYAATAVPRDEQRTTLTIMSMTRTFGMLLGPLLNLLVARVDSELILSRRLGWRVPVNSNNAPGLIVAASEAALLVATYFFLVDPPPSSGKSGTRRGSGPPVRAGLKDIWEAVTNFDLLLPISNMFVVMFK